MRRQRRARIGRSRAFQGCDLSPGISSKNGGQVVEQGVRLCDLVIHVHEDRNVDRTSWQPRIVWLTSGRLISTRSGELVKETVVCLTLANWRPSPVGSRAIQLQPKPDLLVTAGASKRRTLGRWT
jgi:hypothetical protein